MPVLGVHRQAVEVGDGALGAEALLQLLQLQRHIVDGRVQLAGDEVALAVRRQDLRELLASLGDELEIFIRVARIGRTSATYEGAAYRTSDDLLMVTAAQVLVLVDLDERKAVPIPDSYKEAVRAFEGEALET